MTFLAGQVLTAGQINTRVATTPITTDSATFNSTTEVSLFTVDADLVAGRKYRVAADVAFSSDAAGPIARVRIRQDTVAGALLRILDVELTAVSAVGYSVHIAGEYTPASNETKTFVLSAGRDSGAGILKIDGSSLGQFYVDYVPEVP